MATHEGKNRPLFTDYSRKFYMRTNYVPELNQGDLTNSKIIQNIVAPLKPGPPCASQIFKLETS